MTCSHYETRTDNSPRGTKYLDDRTRLGAVYDGDSLIAMLYDERETERYINESPYAVVLTGAGECRIHGRCNDE